MINMHAKLSSGAMDLKFGPCLNLHPYFVFESCLSSDETAQIFFLFCFVALRPKSTAMVMAGQSVHLTTLFPGQA